MKFQAFFTVGGDTDKVAHAVLKWRSRSDKEPLGEVKLPIINLKAINNQFAYSPLLLN